MKIILASKSPRRKEILEMLDIDFEIFESTKEELLEENLEIEKQVQNLAYNKAKDVFERTSGDRIVIGADTMVADDDGNVFGKPKTKEDAIKMLNALNNKRHKVVTGLCILIQKDGKYIENIDYDKAYVYFENMTQEEIEKWIDTGEAYDKAGGYAVQGKFAKHIEKIDGNYMTVKGLPIHKVYKILKMYIDI